MKSSGKELIRFSSAIECFRRSVGCTTLAAFGNPTWVVTANDGSSIETLPRFW